MNNTEDGSAFHFLGIPGEPNPQLPELGDMAVEISKHMLDKQPAREQQLAYENSQLKQENEKLEYAANHDELTGLPNDKWFREELSTAVEEHPGEIAVLVLDLDNFKTINDTQGHAVGDEHLKRLAANILLKNVRTKEEQPKDGEKRHILLEDAVGTGEFHLKQQGAARLHGDEFAVLLEGVNDPATLELVMKRIQGSLLTTDISASIGGKIHEKGESPEALIEAADAAMYKQKTARRLKKMHDLANSEQTVSFS